MTPNGTHGSNIDFREQRVVEISRNRESGLYIFFVIVLGVDRHKNGETIRTCPFTLHILAVFTSDSFNDSLVSSLGKRYFSALLSSPG